MEDKKQEVLEAAKRIFAQYGYTKSTMSDIGRAVGLNKASLYYHYKDKLALFQAVVESLRSEHACKTQEKLDQFKSYKDKIINFILSEIGFSQEVSVMFKYDSDFKDEIAYETKEVYYRIINEDIATMIEMIQSGVNGESLHPVMKPLLQRRFYLRSMQF